MIKGVLIVNNHGMPRLVKFYKRLSQDDEGKVVRRIFQQVAQRPDSFCNYLEGIIPEWGEETKLIYRHYATLYFVFAVDSQESDLGILDLIQVFVEVLDCCFENVCELDLVGAAALHSTPWQDAFLTHHLLLPNPDIQQ
jgi:AP-3 complex subunit sigma